MIQHTDDPQTVDINKELSKIDSVAVFSLLRDMNNTLMAQARATNNSVAKLLASVNNLQEDLHIMIHSLDSTRERRFDEEIADMENKLVALTAQLNEKRSAKVDLKTTSERVRTVTKEELDKEAKRKEEENKKKQIDWVVVRQTTVQAIAAALAVGLVWAIIANAPAIGLFLKILFGK